MENSNKFKGNLIKSIITIAILAFVIRASYSFFSTSSSSAPRDITIGKIGLTFDDGIEWLNATAMLPIAEYEIYDKAAKKTFSITNSGNINEYVDINLSNLVVSSNLRSFDVKWALYEGENKITTGTFLNGNSDINITNNILLSPEQVKNYTLYIWINETGENQYLMSQPAEGEMDNPSISLKIVANALHKEKNTLISNYDITNAKNNPLFTSNSTDNGIYVEKDNSEKSEFGFPVYYFRGNVNNNYVSFAGLTWRIIMFNEDGSIKIISETKPSSLLNLSYNTNGDNVDYLNSTIISSVNSWYTSTVTSTIQSKVSNSMFCNDISESNVDRLSTNINPTFTCGFGKNKVITNVATITADEVLYAGGLVNTTVTNNSYLNNGEQFFTLTGAGNNTNLYAWGVDNAFLNSYISSNTYSIRPVINLKSSVTVASGEGTSINPYVIN